MIYASLLIKKSIISSKKKKKYITLLTQNCWTIVNLSKGIIF